MVFIPQEYLFLFFNHGQKDIYKKVAWNNALFITESATMIILELKKEIKHKNILPTAPFPPGQNLLVIDDKYNRWGNWWFYWNIK